MARRVAGPAAALDDVGSPRLALVREPDQLGVERARQQLAFGVRRVELIGAALSPTLAPALVLGREQRPVPLGNDVDGAVDDLEGGLVVDRVRGA